MLNWIFKWLYFEDFSNSGKSLINYLLHFRAMEKCMD